MHPRARGCAVVGIVGGIGSGKSTVAGLFGELGAKVFDADAICAELHDAPEMRQAIRARWGAAMFKPDGVLDRERLADVVFGDAEELGHLNRLLHPRVIERVRKEVAECKNPGGPAMCVIDAPLLVESGLIDLCDAVVFVECEPETRLRRLAKDRHWTADEIHRREVHQDSLDRKRQLADFVIVNSGGLASTRERVALVAANFKRIGE